MKKEFSLAEFLVNIKMNSSGNSFYIYSCSSAVAATVWPCWVSVKKKRLHTQMCAWGPKFAEYEERRGNLYGKVGIYND